jgi:hypothetical protein
MADHLPPLISPRARLSASSFKPRAPDVASPWFKLVAPRGSFWSVPPNPAPSPRAAASHIEELQAENERLREWYQAALREQTNVEERALDAEEQVSGLREELASMKLENEGLRRDYVLQREAANEAQALMRHAQQETRQLQLAYENPREYHRGDNAYSTRFFVHGSPVKELDQRTNRLITKNQLLHFDVIFDPGVLGKRVGAEWLPDITDQNPAHMPVTRLADYLDEGA